MKILNTNVKLGLTESVQFCNRAAVRRVQLTKHYHDDTYTDCGSSSILVLNFFLNIKPKFIAAFVGKIYFFKTTAV
jgi:hypothetical protein